MVKQDIEKVMVFDAKETVKLEGDTGPYLQYTHARAHKILVKAGEQGELEPDPGLLSTRLLSTRFELALAKGIGRLPYVVKEASETLTPRLLALHAYNMALAFNDFYENCPVIAAETQPLRHSRLSLVRCFVQAFGNELRLLGIEPLKEM